MSKRKITSDGNTSSPVRPQHARIRTVPPPTGRGQSHSASLADGAHDTQELRNAQTQQFPKLSHMPLYCSTPLHRRYPALLNKHFVPLHVGPCTLTPAALLRVYFYASPCAHEYFRCGSHQQQEESTREFRSFAENNTSSDTSAKGIWSYISSRI